MEKANCSKKQTFSNANRFALESACSARCGLLIIGTAIDENKFFTTGQKICSKRKQIVQCHYFGYTQHKSEWVSEA